LAFCKVCIYNEGHGEMWYLQLLSGALGVAYKEVSNSTNWRWGSCDLSKWGKAIISGNSKSRQPNGAKWFNYSWWDGACVESYTLLRDPQWRKWCKCF
jgi:hypothetical protein